MIMNYAGSIHSRELVKTFLLFSEEAYTVKLYRFTKAMEEGVFKNKESANEYLIDTLVNHPQVYRGSEYSIAFAWGPLPGDEAGTSLGIKRKALDILSYKFGKPWTECNPDVSGWTFRERNRCGNVDLLCETGTIILGEEAKLRRTTASKQEFLNKWPDIGDLGPIEEQSNI